MNRRRCRGEDGASLILALAVLIVLSAFVVAVLAVGQVAFKTTGVARSATNATYAADGGVDAAIQMMRADRDAHATPSYCPNVATGTKAIAIPAINGQAISATCTTISGGVKSLDYAMMALGSAGITTMGSGNKNLEMGISGNVYTAGPFTMPTKDKGDVIIGGNLDTSAATCPYDDTTNPQVTGACNANVSPTVATPTVFIPPTSPVNPAPQTVDSCIIYYPGRYTTLANFKTNKSYYFASGTYYFDGIGTFTIQGDVTGGARGSDAALSSVTPCADDAAAADAWPAGYTAAGSGVTFVLGGDSTLKFGTAKTTNVELFARSPSGADAAATPGVSIWASKGTGGTTGAPYTASTASDVYDTGGKAADVVVHGLVYVAQSDVTVARLPNDDASGAAQLMGGLIADSIVIDMASGAGSATLASGGGSASTTPRTVVVRATATPSTGAPSIAQAVITITSVVGSAPAVVSWRRV